jgi:hypothetical protein
MDQGHNWVFFMEKGQQSVASVLSKKGWPGTPEPL